MQRAGTSGTPCRLVPSAAGREAGIGGVPGELSRGPGGQSRGGIGGVLPPSPCLQPGGVSSVSGFFPWSPGPTASPAEGASLCDSAGGASHLTLPRARSTPAPPFALVDKATGTSPSSQNVKPQNLREGGHPPSPTSPSLQVTHPRRSCPRHPLWHWALAVTLILTQMLGMHVRQPGGVSAGHQGSGLASVSQVEGGDTGAGCLWVWRGP